MVPLFPWHELRKLTTKEGALHVVADFMVSNSLWCPQFYRDNVYDANGQITVPGLRSECSSALFKIGTRHLYTFYTHTWLFFVGFVCLLLV